MNSDIQDFINNYQGQINMYSAKLSDDHEKVQEASKYLAKMTLIGENSSDMNSFMVQVTEHDMMNKMYVYITDLATTTIKVQQESGQMKIPSAKQAAQAYHSSFESIQGKEKLPRTCEVYERVFSIEEESSDAAVFMTRMAEECLFLQLTTVHQRESYKSIVKESDELSQPAMAHHEEQMIKAAELVKSVIELEYEAERLSQLNRMEQSADTLLIQQLFSALGIPLIEYIVAPDEKKRLRVEYAYRFLVEFYGLDADALYELPRLIDYVSKVFLPSTQQKGDTNSVTYQEYVDEYKNALLTCLKNCKIDKNPDIQPKARLWNNDYSLKEILDVIRHKPNRPVEYES